MNVQNKKILFISPHTDDVELGCGGVISKLIKTNDVYVVIFSFCEKSLSNNAKGSLRVESLQSLISLGVKSENIISFDYEVRIFSKFRQEILDDLIILKSKINPDIIFIPSKNDIHQDHNTIFNESLRCFKNSSSILCYELPWNNLNFNNDICFCLEQNDIENKINALSKYKSQSSRSYFNNDFIKSLAVTRGVQNDTKYAEIFEVIKIIIR